MNTEFISTISNQRKLKKALNGLSLNELESIQDKLSNIIDDVKLKALEEEEKEQKELLKLEELKNKIVQSGVDFNKLSQIMKTPKKRKASKPTPSN
ncbi:hypothetical protein HC725_15855 [Vibrio sp. S17_S38]|uniref:H-NS family histone-like protein n=1 Tax=Vibrio sp. S17_S38 TaxID=2720229 RepID=UPI0016801D07|nr:hypothetical protein [Vibrio sp. S17_S38]MBD1574728.1 hypothetical protein [Vibrio sp. S17_S38]